MYNLQTFWAWVNISLGPLIILLKIKQNKQNFVDFVDKLTNYEMRWKCTEYFTWEETEWWKHFQIYLTNQYDDDIDNYDETIDG